MKTAQYMNKNSNAVECKESLHKRHNGTKTYSSTLILVMLQYQKHLVAPQMVFLSVVDAFLQFGVLHLQKQRTQPHKKSTFKRLPKPLLLTITKYLLLGN